LTRGIKSYIIPDRKRGIMTTTLILIQMLMGFVCAFLGVIVMFHSGEVWLGFGITILGFFAVLRALHHRDTYAK